MGRRAGNDRAQRSAPKRERCDLATVLGGEPKARGHLSLTLVEREKRQLSRVRREEKRIGKVPEIGSSQKARAGGSVDLTGQRTIRINPGHDGEQIGAAVRDPLSNQCGSEFRLE